MEAVSFFEKEYSISELDGLYETNDLEFPCGDGHIIVAHVHREEEGDGN